MSEWKEVKIEEIAEKIGMGPFGSSIKVSTFVDKGIPIISGQHLNETRLKENEFNFITNEHADKLKSANVKRGDIIFTHAGNIGQVSFIPENSIYDRYILSQRQFFMRCDLSKAIPEYITYFFETRIGRHLLLSNKSQTGVPSIARPVTHLRSIRIPLPPISEQKKITYVLGIFDQKINLIHHQNKTLEDIAQTLFKRWFVEFEFPNEDGKPYKSSGGKMVQSELGEIPESWRIGKLGDEFKILMGQSPPGESYNKNGEGMIFFQGRTDFGFRFPSKRLYTTQPKRIAEKYDVLVSVRAPVGDVNVAFERCCIGRGLSAVNCKHKSYCLYKMKSLKKVFALFESEGTVFGALNKEDFNRIKNILPEEGIIQKFENIVQSMYNKIYINASGIHKLTSLRDLLLPKLMSGQIRVNK